MIEAMELAKRAFRANVESNLSADELGEFRRLALMGSGDPSDGWQGLLGFIPKVRDYYQYDLYKPSDTPPYVEKYYAKILVARDRNSDFCQIVWRPPVEPYEGPSYS